MQARGFARVTDVTTTMLRVAAQLDAAAGLVRQGLDTKIPRLFRKKSTLEAVRLLHADSAAQARAAVRQLEPLGERFQGVRDALGVYAHEVERATTRPHPPGMSIVVSEHEVGRLRQQADLLRLRVELEARPAAQVQAELGAELDQLLRRDHDTLTQRDAWRAGLLWLLPEHQRPAFAPANGRTLAESAARGWLGDQGSRYVWENQRIGLLTRELIADPTFTREIATSQARAIVEKSYDKVTLADSKRLSALARLPDHLRPAFLDTPVPLRREPVSTLGALRKTPREDKYVAAKYDALRMGLHGERMAAGGTITRESATEELVSILSRTNDTITIDQLRRVSQLSRLPESLRPPIPPPLPQHHRFQDMGLLGYLPGDSTRMAAVVNDARAYVFAHADPDGTAQSLARELAAGRSIEPRSLTALEAADPDALRRHSIPDLAAQYLRSQTDAGEVVDLRLLDVLADHGDALARHGVDDTLLERQAVIALGQAGMKTRNVAGQLEAHLQTVRDRLQTAPVADELAAARDEALTLADRNLARIRGERFDTYGRHPDYAEVGRIVATAKLLDQLAPRPAAVDDAARGAAVAGEQLGW